MRIALIVLNALAVVAGAAFFILGLIYGRPGDWGARDAIKLLLLVAPFIAALFAGRERASSFTRSLAVWWSAAWALPLIVLGIGASTGIGGMIGLLIVIAPALLLLSFNWFVLRKGGSLEA
jgi:hypothetical protein